MFQTIQGMLMTYIYIYIAILDLQDPGIWFGYF